MIRNFKLIVATLFLQAILTHCNKQHYIPEITWEVQNSGTPASFRGMSVVNNEIVWLGGNNSTFAHTLDGGVSWLVDTLESEARLDFRDVHAVSSDTVYLMSAGPGELSRIYKTVDGGKTWKLQFKNSYADGFFNSITFWNPGNGIAVSDPVKGKLLIMTTNDGGKNWKRIPHEKLPAVFEGEYGFAASGSNAAVFRENIWIATGGAGARVFYSKNKGKSWKVAETPTVSGTQSSGIFSIAFRDKKHGVVVGGDFRNPGDRKGNVATTTDGGVTWKLIDNPASVAFQSCVAFLPLKNSSFLISVGTSGSNRSFDGGLTWTQIDTVGYHTLDFSPSGKFGWAAGADGRIVKLLIH